MTVFVFVRFVWFVAKKDFQYKLVDKIGFLAIIGDNLFLRGAGGP
jgi:hypothetical protein